MSSTILQRRSIPLIPLLAREIGTNEALVLQQISYWLERSKTSHGGKKWVYNTTKEWVDKEFCFMSESTLKRVLVNLKDLGLIESKKLSKRTGYHINYYTVNYVNVAKLDAKISAIELQQIKDLDTDDVSSISSDWPNDNSISSDWPNHESVNMDCSGLGQNDTTNSESSNRVHTKSTRASAKKEKPVKFKPVKPDEVSEQIWNDLLILRKETKASNSQTAWTTVFNGLAKAQQATGHSLDQIITFWIGKAWKGFNADWYLNAQPKPQQTNYQGNNHANHQSANSQPNHFDQLRAEAAAKYGNTQPNTGELRTVN